MEKELGQTRKPLQTGKFLICPYYTIRAYVRDPGAPERRRYQDRLWDAGPLFGRFHSGHLHPRYHRRKEGGGKHDGEYPLWRCPVVSGHSKGTGWQ